MSSQNQKKVLVGRLWEREDKSKSGYLEFGIMGRIQIIVTPNIQKKDISNSDFNILMRVDDTPYAMLKNTSKNINQALFEDEENPYENEKEEEKTS